MQVAKRLCSILLLPCIALSLCSCMPSHELKELGIVEGVAVDSSGEGFSLTFQLYNPKGSGGSGQEQGGGGSSEELVVTGSGKSIYDAIRNATLAEGRKLYFSNARIFVVSEDICKGSFSAIEDFFERPVEIRRDVNILVARGRAADFLTSKKNGKIISAMDFSDVIQNSYVSSKIVNMNIGTMSIRSSDGISDLTLAAVGVSKLENGDAELRVEGTAVLRDNRLAGYLTDLETRGLLWATGKVNSGILVLGLRNGGRVSLEVVKSTADIRVSETGGKPSVNIAVKFASGVAENENSNVNLTDKQEIQELEALQEQEVKKEIEQMIDRGVHGCGADILGLGMMFYQNKPALWRKISPHWKELLRTLPVTVTVKSSIGNLGNITQ